MAQAVFHFRGELNDFLPRHRRSQVFRHAFEHRASIKDMIESLGVPHPEVDLILVNGEAVDWSYIMRDGDHVEVYPPSVPAAGSSGRRLGPPRPAEARFVLDAHLGKLAAYLRLLGFDTLYRNDYDDEELATIAGAEARILLTRDRNLLKRNSVIYGYFVRETAPRRQVVEVLRRFELFSAVGPYRRCVRCNGTLHPVGKADIADRLAPRTRQFYEEFHLCDTCGQIYWKGSHYEPLQQFVDTVLMRERAGICRPSMDSLTADQTRAGGIGTV